MKSLWAAVQTRSHKKTYIPLLGLSAGLIWNVTSRPRMPSGVDMASLAMTRTQ